MSKVVLESGAVRHVGTVWCIGRSYAQHARELGNPVPTEPLVFLKPATAVRGLEPEPVAFAEETFDHECELVLLVGRAVALGEEPGWEAVEAVGVGLDLTRRDMQQHCKEQGLPWAPAKAFAGSAVVAPMVERESLGDPRSLRFSLEIDGSVRQAGAVADMLFDIPGLLAHLARHAPLCPGDLVYTGTPQGIGPIRVGDGFILRLEGPSGRRSFTGRL